MATEAEAAREARAKVIAAEGEQKASKALRAAAEVISESPIAIQLRYLQTLTQIASERNSTIVFPIPLEMLSFLANKTQSKILLDKFFFYFFFIGDYRFILRAEWERVFSHKFKFFNRLIRGMIGNKTKFKTHKSMNAVQFCKINKLFY